MVHLLHRAWYFPTYIARLTAACRSGLCGWQMYLTYWFYEIRLFARTYADIAATITVLVLYGIAGITLWSWWSQEGSFHGFSSVATSLGTKVLRYIPERLGIISPKDAAEEKYDVNDAYGDPKVLATGLVGDLKHVGIKAGRKDLFTLLKVATQKGKPVDDKLMTVSKLFYQMNSS